MAQIELSSLVGLTQSYIAKNYATALIDKSKTAELKAYIGKYLYDTGYSVRRCITLLKIWDLSVVTFLNPLAVSVTSSVFYPKR